ncbi:MAG: hypothetical protein Q7S08_00520 [bacterium]|nr:hypothetical protein [bacterium]
MKQENQKTKKRTTIAHTGLRFVTALSADKSGGYWISASRYPARGMTLLEAAVWVSILTLVLLALNASLLFFYRTNKYAVEQSTAVTSAQHGIDRLVRIIREASYSSQGAFPVVSTGANDFVFYADVDADLLIEKVHYYISGTNLMQGITDATGDPPGYTTAEATSTLSDYVRNISQNVSTFRYYDVNGAEITDYSKWANVRFVNVNLAVNVDPNKLPNQLTMSSSAALRNLK